MNNDYFMREALKQAQIAYSIGEVPVGAVVEYKNEIIAYGYNKRETEKNALYHAEIMAIDNACKVLHGWRLWQCKLYVTLEPCPMCAGAIINARIPEVVFGCSDLKNGSCGSVINLFDLQYNHKPTVTGGVLENECSEILSDFFKNLRKKS
ncbi:MAG: tRNA adenosine(34) deaminase TadA [Bacillota bacterium]|nr:tRNA adenosine(34) deaminase TadA [Bacillota bacterium]